LNRILITGASGFLGSYLTGYLRAKNFEGIPLKVNPKTGLFPTEILENAYAIINLAGENITSKRWSNKQKAKILESRVDTTKKLAASIEKLKKPPKVFLSGSAIGFYGDQGEKELTEESASGSGFLAEVSKRWEEAARVTNTRYVLMRTGVVLGNGGALKQMTLPYKMCLGGKLGSGKQYISWIHIEDWARGVLFAIENEIEGPINLTAPTPVTQEEFSKTLAGILKRPALFHLPKSILKFLMGEKANILLFSTRVFPKKLLQKGFHFNYTNLISTIIGVIL